MNAPASTAPDPRRRSFFFWLGIALTTTGVLLHLPMYVGAARAHYRLAGMAPDPEMIAGMVLLAIGLASCVYGLWPRRALPEVSSGLRVRAMDEARLGWRHVRLLLVMAVAVTIDVMKPTTLAFVVPGVAREYGLRSPVQPTGSVPVALLPLAGITGTVIGSFIWGRLGDRIGRRAAMLLAGVLFVATAICGAMPSFELNLLMCFMMGMGVGGMLPIAFVLLSETMPARHRGWLLVLVGGDVAGAYILTSWLSSLLAPTYGWRIMWLIGLPTGLLLILLTRWVPESPRYLLSVGLVASARKVLRDYRAILAPAEPASPAAGQPESIRLWRPPFQGLTFVLALCGLGIGFVVFGFQLWLPSDLRHLGYTGVTADTILRDSAILGLPLNFVVAYLYHRSTRWTLMALGLVVALALAAFAVLGDQAVANRPLLSGLLIVPIWAPSSVAAVLVAYSAEVYPTIVRSSGSGVASGMTKAGGVLIIALVVAGAAAPSISTMAFLAVVPIALGIACGLVVLVETRGRSLEDITAERRQAVLSPWL